MRNKGFTLVELLAVIALIAIIALIIIPITTNLISDSKEDVAKVSTINYVKNINDYTSYTNIDYDEVTSEYNVKLPEINDTLTCTKIDNVWNKTCRQYMTAVETKIKGDKPKYATITLNEDGKVTNATIYLNGQIVSYTKNNTEIIGTYTSDSDIKLVQLAGNLVYFDPVSENTCDKTTFNLNNVKNGTSTCYKWRIINEDVINETITLQMDHNLVNKSAWSPSSNSTGPTTALSALATATAGWNNALLLNYTYDTTGATNNYGTLTCTSGSCTITGNSEPIATGLKARMITGEEITAITKTKNSSLGWTLASSYNDYYYFSNKIYDIGTKTIGTGDTDLSWLIENTTARVNSGATANTYGDANNGYWTLSPVSGESISAWYVDGIGHLYSNYVGIGSSFGVRPVITISKTKISS